MSNQIGPVGGPGTSWNNLPAVEAWGLLSSLVIRSGDVIDAIQPAYGDRSAPSQGGTGGNATRQSLAGDPIVAITGYTGTYYGATQVVQLSFKTLSGKVIGPFGTMGGVQNPKSFELTAPAGQQVNSFFGATVVHTDGTTYIASIGGNVQPLPKLVSKLGPAGGATTSTFDDWPAAQHLGSITSVSVWHGEVVDALQAGYNGRTLPRHGGGGGGLSVASFTPADPLVEVSGSYGSYYGATQILQITLKSRSGKVYGPYGSGSGTSFSFSAGKNQIGAFFGGDYRHSDGSDFLSSLGVCVISA
ncbi:jacalin-like lectin [Sorangium sp. So ce1024]|uniref:jacalin-like lectin n=1 Tax=unclassified Sorangium TaxID=2621164 RepID=UPI003F125987